MNDVVVKVFVLEGHSDLTPREKLEILIGQLTLLRRRRELDIPIDIASLTRAEYLARQIAGMEL